MEPRTFVAPMIIPKIFMSAKSTPFPVVCVEVVKFDIAVLVIVLTRLPTGLSDSLNDDANVNDWCVESSQNTGQKIVGIGCVISASL